MVTTLDPYLTMRKDGNRVIVYPNIYAQFHRSFDFSWRFVAPRAALVISLFDGVRAKEEVTSIWSNLNECSTDAALMEVDRILDEYDSIMYTSDAVPDHFQPCDPEELVCNVSMVDYSTSRLHTPTSMLLVPTLYCGHYCRYCYADRASRRDPNELTLEQIENILDQCYAMKFSDVNVSGGDPFLRADFMEILDMLFSRGFQSDVPTKSPLSAKQIQRLKEIGVNRIQISLDSPFDRKTVEYLTGRRDYFDDIMRTLRDLGEAGFEVGITSVVTAQTIDSVPQMAEYYAELGFVNRVSFSPVGASIYRAFPDLYAPNDKLAAMEAEINNMQSAYPETRLKFSYIKDPAEMDLAEREEFFPKRPGCSGGRFAFVCLPDGKVTVCEELYYHPAFIVGDLKKQTIQEMWNSPEMLRVLQPDREEFRGSPCYDCEELLECHTTRGRCWKRALKAFGDRPNAAAWPDPYCPKAPKIEARLG